MIERMYLFSRGEFGDYCAVIYAHEADRDYRDTDAGLHETFIVRGAPSAEAARDAGQRWLANRADDNEPSDPDDLALEEREYRPGKTYMTLRLL